MAGEVVTPLPSTTGSVAPYRPDLVSGVVLEAADLGRTASFYEPIFRWTGGHWIEGSRTLAYEASRQRIEFVQRGRPRTLPDSGHHQAYRVPSEDLQSLVSVLERAGHHVDWWHEDYPSERGLSPYFHDPAGNRVQLVPAEGGDVLLDHGVFEVHDIEHAELFYVHALGGEASFDCGWSVDDYHGLEGWMAGDDPAAPWTRRINYSYRDHLPEPLVNPQVYLSFGPTRLGFVLTAVHRQEPPPFQVKGTPRMVLHSHCPADEVERHLSTVVVSPIALNYAGGRVAYEREGDHFFLRDPSGHFVELVADP